MKHNLTLNDNQIFVLSLLFISFLFFPICSFDLVDLDDINLINSINSSSNFLLGYARTNDGKYYRPLLNTLSIIESRLWGLHASGYHTTNYVIHLINAVLLFFISGKLFRQHTQYKKYACAVMLLFAVHPLSTESVAWISGRSDLYATLFSFTAYSFYLSRNKYKYVLVPICCILGLMCKESTLAVIPILLLSEMYFMSSNKQKGNHNVRMLFLWSSILLFTLFVYVILRTGTIHNYGPQFIGNILSGENKGGFSLRGCLILPAAIMFYLKKLVVPFPQNFAIHHINIYLYSIVFTLFTTVNLYWLLQKKIRYVFWSVLIVVSFAPALPVAYGTFAWMPFAERYVYLSLSVFSVGFIFFIAEMQNKKTINSKKLNTYFIIFILILSFFTFKRICTWENNQTLWADTIKKSPLNGKVLYLYGNSLDENEGEKYFRRAIALSGKNEWKDKSYMALATFEKKQNNNKNALVYIKNALKLNGDYYNYQKAGFIIKSMNWKNKNEQQKGFELAITYFKKALKKKTDPALLYEIGRLNMMLKNYASAHDAFDIIASHFPNSTYAKLAMNCIARIENKNVYSE